MPIASALAHEGSIVSAEASAALLVSARSTTGWLIASRSRLDFLLISHEAPNHLVPWLLSLSAGDTSGGHGRSNS